MVLNQVLFFSSGNMEPIASLKRQREDVSFEHCIICQESSRAKDTVFNQTDQGIASIREATELRCKLRHCEFRPAVDRLSLLFAKPQDSIPKLKWHKLCYAAYTHKGKINAKLEKEQSKDEAKAQGSERECVSDEGHRFLCSSTTKVDWTVCMFCQKFDKKQKTSRVTTFDVSDDIMTKAKFVHEILVRTTNENDLISAESCYHANCLKKFYRDVKKGRESEQSN